MNCCEWKTTPSTYCHQQFESPAQLYEHITKEHIGRKSEGSLCLECKWSGCDLEFKKRDHIVSHVKVHVPDYRPFTCKICEKGFSRLQDMKKHEKIHDKSPTMKLESPEHSPMKTSANSDDLLRSFTSAMAIKSPLAQEQPPEDWGKFASSVSLDQWLEQEQNKQQLQNNNHTEEEEFDWLSKSQPTLSQPQQKQLTNALGFATENKYFMEQQEMQRRHSTPTIQQLNQPSFPQRRPVAVPTSTQQSSQYRPMNPSPLLQQPMIQQHPLLSPLHAYPNSFQFPIHSGSPIDYSNQQFNPAENHQPHVSFDEQLIKSKANQEAQEKQPLKMEPKKSILKKPVKRELSLSNQMNEFITNIKKMKPEYSPALAHSLNQLTNTDVDTWLETFVTAEGEQQAENHQVVDFLNELYQNLSNDFPEQNCISLSNKKLQAQDSLASAFTEDWMEEWSQLESDQEQQRMNSLREGLEKLTFESIMQGAEDKMNTKLVRNHLGRFPANHSPTSQLKEQEKLHLTLSDPLTLVRDLKLQKESQKEKSNESPNTNSMPLPEVKSKMSPLKKSKSIVSNSMDAPGYAEASSEDFQKKIEKLKKMKQAHLSIISTILEKVEFLWKQSKQLSNKIIE